MESYYARLGTSGGDRFIAVTGRLGDSLRYVVVDARGNPQGDFGYLPAGSILQEMELSPDGFLIDTGSVNDQDEEIEWALFEDNSKGEVYEDEAEPDVHVVQNANSLVADDL